MLFLLNLLLLRSSISVVILLLYLAVFLFLELSGQLHVLVQDLLLALPMRVKTTRTVIHLVLQHHRQLVVAKGCFHVLLVGYGSCHVLLRALDSDHRVLFVVVL